MAAVEEHQFRHDPHRLDFGRAEEGVAREDNAPFCARRAVAGDVDDAIRTLEQGIDDVACVVGAAGQRPDVRRIEAGRPSGEPRRDRDRLGARTGQRRIDALVDHRLADDEHAAISIGVRDLGTELPGAELPQELAADRPGPGIAARDLRAGRVEQLPGNRRGAGVELDHHLAGATEEGLHFDRNQQVEQGAADLGVAVRVVRGLGDELAHQRALGLLGANFGARPARVEVVGDGRFAIAALAGDGADEVVGRAAIARIE